MRVEINFAGDSHDAVSATDFVARAVAALHGEAERTGRALDDVTITVGQAAETDRNARRMAQSVEQIGQEARKSRRELEALKLAGASGRSGVGLGPLGSGFGRVGLLGTAVGLGVTTSGPLAGGAAALGVGALSFAGPAAAMIGVLVGSLHGLGDAIGGDRQAFEKLSPATQGFVQDVRSLIPWLKDLQETAREGLLPGIDKGLHAALSPGTTSGIENVTSAVSGELGKLTAQAGQGLGGPQFQTFLNDIATHGVSQLDDLGHAAGHLASALLTLDHAGQPLADWLARVTDDGARFVDEWLKAADASGSLGDKLGGAQHELELIGHLVGALADAAFHLGDDLTPLGNKIIVDLTHALQVLADWLDKNHDKVVELTTGALTGLENIITILSPIVSAFAKELDKVAQAVGGWDTAFTIILSGVLVKALLGIGAAAGEQGAAGKVGLLSTRLTGLNAITIAPIVIPLAIAISQKEKDWITKHFGAAGAALFDGIMTVAGGGVMGGPQAVYNDLFGGGGKGGGKFDYPLASTGKIIGTPYQGTHGKAFNQAGGSDNWESENAVDIAVKQGTPVVAVEDGVIGKQIGSLGTGGRFAGLRLHLLGDSGNEYYYAHLSTILVKAGQRVKKGEPLGMSGSANGVAHLHFAQKSGNPQSTISGAALAGGLSAPAISGAGGGSGGGGSAPGIGSDAFGTPPPFGDDKGANLLPASIRLAMAKSATTPSKKDDVRDTKRAIAWLRAHVGGLTGEDQINAYLELASLLGQLKSLGTAVKKRITEFLPGALLEQTYRAQGTTATTADDVVAYKRDIARLKRVIPTLHGAAHTAAVKELSEYQKKLAGVKPTNDDLEKLQAVQAITGRYGLARSMDVAQSRVLGGPASKSVSVSLVQELQAALGIDGPAHMRHRVAAHKPPKVEIEIHLTDAHLRATVKKHSDQVSVTVGKAAQRRAREGRRT